jgi:hypothetical protein
MILLSAWLNKNTVKIRTEQAYRFMCTLITFNVLSSNAPQAEDEHEPKAKSKKNNTSFLPPPFPVVQKISTS